MTLVRKKYGTIYKRKDTLLLAHRFSTAPILLRMDSGNDAEDNLRICYERASRCEFIIKRLLSRESCDGWYELAKAEATLYQPREGKKVYIGSIFRKISVLEKVRIVYEVIERTSKSQWSIVFVTGYRNQHLMEFIDRTRKGDDRAIPRGRSEQYHSELKSDMDIKRLPSGKFQTNQLVLELAMIT